MEFVTLKKKQKPFRKILTELPRPNKLRQNIVGISNLIVEDIFMSPFNKQEPATKLHSLNFLNYDQFETSPVKYTNYCKTEERKKVMS